MSPLSVRAMMNGSRRWLINSSGICKINEDVIEVTSVWNKNAADFTAACFIQNITLNYPFHTLQHAMAQGTKIAFDMKFMYKHIQI